eukprot:3436906-Rhodomonas_salina.1
MSGTDLAYGASTIAPRPDSNGARQWVRALLLWVQCCPVRRRRSQLWIHYYHFRRRCHHLRRQFCHLWRPHYHYRGLTTIIEASLPFRRMLLPFKEATLPFMEAWLLPLSETALPMTGAVLTCMEVIPLFMDTVLSFMDAVLPYMEAKQPFMESALPFKEAVLPFKEAALTRRRHTTGWRSGGECERAGCGRNQRHSTIAPVQFVPERGLMHLIPRCEVVLPRRSAGGVRVILPSHSRNR